MAYKYDNVLKLFYNIATKMEKNPTALMFSPPLV
jgi:hypothetical protein